MFNDSADPPINRAVLAIAQIIKAVMSSATEVKLGVLYMSCCKAIPTRHIPIEMGHQRPPTLVETDNTTALGVVNKTIYPRWKKSTDMHFHWLRDRIQ